MANTRKTALPKKTDVAEVSEAAETKEIVSTTVAQTAAKKTAVPAKKLDDSVLVYVQSNTYGGLTYVDKHNGDMTEWSNVGDVQTMTMGSLRSMKSTQRAFFENQWIFVLGIAESGYEDVTPDDIYKALMVTQYYSGVLGFGDINSMLSWDADKIRSVVSKMSSGAKTNIVVAANTAIKDGSLDSLRKIHVLEEVLECELDKPE